MHSSLWMHMQTDVFLHMIMIKNKSIDVRIYRQLSKWNMTTFTKALWTWCKLYPVMIAAKWRRKIANTTPQTVPTCLQLVHLKMALQTLRVRILNIASESEEIGQVHQVIWLVAPWWQMMMRWQSWDELGEERLNDVKCWSEWACFLCYKESVL